MEIYKKYQLTDRDLNRIIEMAWEDRTPFDAIEVQFGLSEAEVIQVMRREMHPRNWRKWRARVQGRATKHRRKRNQSTTRFRAAAQRHISLNRISKRK
jgi:uncharacterized protein (TIGR03643 family)